MFYPIAVLVVAFIVTTILLVFVVPQFEEIFSSFGAELPAFTQFVLAISRFVQDYGIFIGMGIAGAIFLFIRALRKSKGLQDKMDALTLKIPVVGEILKKSGGCPLYPHPVNNLFCRCSVNRRTGFCCRCIRKCGVPGSYIVH